MSLGKKVFTQKTYGSNLYKWSPLPNDNTKAKERGGKRPFYCNAIPYSQGQDWITTYSYNIAVVDGEQEKLAYVECDYVE